MTSVIFSISFLLLYPTLCLFHLVVSLKVLNLCDRYADTYGRWIDNSFANRDKQHGLVNSSTFRLIENHFSNGSPGEAILFSQIWLPQNCSYHRFTNLTLYQSVIKQIEIHRHQQESIRIFIFGDSGVRGIVCGIVRILSGSEIYGPCSNKICGGPGFGDPVSVRFQHRLNEVSFFNGKLIFIFVYVKDFMRDLEGLMTRLLFSKDSTPYAAILNTGVWDFHKVPRQYDLPARKDNQFVYSTEKCATNESLAVSQGRSASWINATMWRLSNLSSVSGVRLIYRNNHHNGRFGTLCADEDFELMIRGSRWEVWDNRRISKDVWKHQIVDGFHFDRNRQHTMEEHALLYNNTINGVKSKVHTVQGQLEMQLAQSLLQSLFHDAIAKLFY